MQARVLIVEDHPGYVALLSAAAHAKGFQVLEPCTEAAEALRRCADLQPEVVILDLHLSGEVEPLELARMLVELRRSPLLVGSGSLAEPGAMEEAFSRGIDRCLRKPFRMEEALRLFDVLAAEFAGARS